MKVVILDSLFRSLDLETEVAERYGATVERWSGDRHQLADADVVAHVRTTIDSELISAMGRCWVITRFGTGVDTVDLGAAKAAGIDVVTVRDYCLVELTSHTLAIAFALVRRLSETAGAFDSNWQDVASRTPLARYGQAVVVGLGSIGRRVLTALLALGYDVTAVTRHQVALAQELGARVASLQEALETAQLVFLHAALDDSTRKLINAETLRAIPAHAIVVNTARLGLLDEAAVADALDQGRLGGLALDASLDRSSPLRRFANEPRVLVTPHVGWYSEQSAAALRRAAVSDALDRAVERQQLGVSKQ